MIPSPRLRTLLPADHLVENALTRRGLLGGLAAAAVLSACSSREQGGSSDGGYRVTVTTPDDGEVTLTRHPRRIAVLNGNRVLPFLNPFLDDEHVVVGYGNDPDPAQFPWIREQLETLPNSPDVDGPDLETYASWTPDLLLANGNVGDYYEPVRQVGPLVHLPETDWRATTTLLGEIFAKPENARQVIAETEEVITQARRTEPVTAAVLSPYQDNGTVGTQVRGAELPNAMVELGIEVADSPTAEGGYEDVALELLAERLAGVDYVVVLDNGGTLQADFLAKPLVRALPVVRAGRVVTFDETQFAASFPVTPPTLPVVIEALRPVLEA